MSWRIVTKEPIDPAKLALMELILNKHIVPEIKKKLDRSVSQMIRCNKYSMKGTTMSNIKRSLPEDIDITDPRDSGNYDLTVPALVDSPDDMDLAIANLLGAIAHVEHQTPADKIVYLDSLGEARDRLNGMIGNIEL